MEIEAKLQALGLVLPAPPKVSPGFTFYAQTTNAINGFSDLILALYGPAVGEHTRIAVGMATLPLNNAVTVAAEVEIAPL